MFGKYIVRICYLQSFISFLDLFFHNKKSKIVILKDFQNNSIGSLIVRQNQAFETPDLGFVRSKVKLTDLNKLSTRSQGFLKCLELIMKFKNFVEIALLHIIKFNKKDTINL